MVNPLRQADAAMGGRDCKKGAYGVYMKGFDYSYVYAYFFIYIYIYIITITSISKTIS